MVVDTRTRHPCLTTACVLAALLGLASDAAAMEERYRCGSRRPQAEAERAPDPDEEAESPVWPELERGTVEWGLAGNFGVAHDLWNAASDREFVSVGMRLGRILSKPRGPGFLRGRLAVNVETYPLFLMFQESTTYAFSFTLLARHYLSTRSRVRPFVSAGAGLLLSRKDIPPDTSRVNFTPQVGIGIAIPDARRRVYTLEYRLHHISNGSLAEENPGVNSSFFQFGVSFFREKR